MGQKYRFVVNKEKINEGQAGSSSAGSVLIKRTDIRSRI